jgi:hypothetical protein
MQDILGLANDSHVASARLDSLRERFRGMWQGDWKPLAPGVDGLLRFHRRRLPRERERFQNWWARWKAEDEPLLKELLAPPVMQELTNGHPLNGSG